MMIRTILAALAFCVAAPALATDVDPALRTAIEAPRRAEANRTRDDFRHPAEVLSFFGIKPDSVVVEIAPGEAGYWTEILAPYLKDSGRYVAAAGAPGTDEGRKEADALAGRVSSDAADYGKLERTTFAADKLDAVPGSADFVLTFRNLHNWMAHGEAEAALRSFYAALKPGGVLGIVDHRASVATPQDPLAKSGYVRQDYAIKLIEQAGFRFVAASEANANPKDTKDYPVGVWALPPTYRMKDVDRAKFQAIGESDRFTLKFVKP